MKMVCLSEYAYLADGFKIRSSCSSLIMKDGKPPGTLGQTAKSYLEDWLIKEIYGIEKTVKSKYFDNGNENEEAALAFTSEMLREVFPLIKNTERKESWFITGVCDADGGDYIADVKCTYTPYSFPLFAQTLEAHEGIDGAYWWQGQCYMHLWGKQAYKLCYCLMDLPAHLVQRELRAEARARGLEPDMEGYAELETEIQAKYTYSVNLKKQDPITGEYEPRPDWLRFKCFEFEYDPAAIVRLEKRVLLCREYIRKLLSGNTEPESEALAAVIPRKKNAVPPAPPVPVAEPANYKDFF